MAIANQETLYMVVVLGEVGGGRAEETEADLGPGDEADGAKKFQQLALQIKLAERRVELMEPGAVWGEGEGGGGKVQAETVH